MCTPQDQIMQGLLNSYAKRNYGRIAIQSQPTSLGNNPTLAVVCSSIFSGFQRITILANASPAMPTPLAVAVGTVSVITIPWSIASKMSALDAGEHLPATISLAKLEQIETIESMLNRAVIVTSALFFFMSGAQYYGLTLLASEVFSAVEEAGYINNDLSMYVDLLGMFGSSFIFLQNFSGETRAEMALIGWCLDAVISSGLVIHSHYITNQRPDYHKAYQDLLWILRNELDDENSKADRDAIAQFYLHLLENKNLTEPKVFTFGDIAEWKVINQIGKKPEYKGDNPVEKCKGDVNAAISLFYTPEMISIFERLGQKTVLQKILQFHGQIDSPLERLSHAETALLNERAIAGQLSINQHSLRPFKGRISDNEIGRFSLVPTFTKMWDQMEWGSDWEVLYTSLYNKFARASRIPSLHTRHHQMLKNKILPFFKKGFDFLIQESSEEDKKILQRLLPLLGQDQHYQHSFNLLCELGVQGFENQDARAPLQDWILNQPQAATLGITQEQLLTEGVELDPNLLHSVHQRFDQYELDTNKDNSVRLEPIYKRVKPKYHSGTHQHSTFNAWVQEPILNLLRYFNFIATENVEKQETAKQLVAAAQYEMKNIFEFALTKAKSQLQTYLGYVHRETGVYAIEIDRAELKKNYQEAGVLFERKLNKARALSNEQERKKELGTLRDTLLEITQVGFVCGAGQANDIATIVNDLREIGNAQQAVHQALSQIRLSLFQTAIGTIPREEQVGAAFFYGENAANGHHILAMWNYIVGNELGLPLFNSESPIHYLSQGEIDQMHDLMRNKFLELYTPQNVFDSIRQLLQASELEDTNHPLRPENIIPWLVGLHPLVQSTQAELVKTQKILTAAGLPETYAMEGLSDFERLAQFEFQLPQRSWLRLKEDIQLDTLQGSIPQELLEKGVSFSALFNYYSIMRIVAPKEAVADRGSTLSKEAIKAAEKLNQLYKRTALDIDIIRKHEAADADNPLDAEESARLVELAIPEGSDKKEHILNAAFEDSKYADIKAGLLALDLGALSNELWDTASKYRRFISSIGNNPIELPLFISADQGSADQGEKAADTTIAPHIKFQAEFKTRYNLNDHDMTLIENWIREQHSSIDGLKSTLDEYVVNIQKDHLRGLAENPHEFKVIVVEDADWDTYGPETADASHSEYLKSRQRQGFKIMKESEWNAFSESEDLPITKQDAMQDMHNIKIHSYTKSIGNIPGYENKAPHDFHDREEMRQLERSHRLKTALNMISDKMVWLIAIATRNLDFPEGLPADTPIAAAAPAVEDNGAGVGGGL